jgi:hypothetical protein
MEVKPQIIHTGKYYLSDQYVRSVIAQGASANLGYDLDYYVIYH